MEQSLDAQPLWESIRLNRFSNIDDTDAIKMLGKAFQHELEYLRHATATAEAGTSNEPTDEEQTPSKLLYGMSYIEVDRSILGMLALKWVLADNYDAFTCCQPSAVKLRQESFAELRALCMICLQHPEDIMTLLIAIVINDLGKSPHFAEEVEAATGRSITGSNHDVIVYIAAKEDMIPCLRELDKARREDILLGLQFGADVNVAQLAQAENVPGSLKGASVMKGHPNAFSFKFLEVIFDVAGAGAHVDARCAKQMIEPVFRSYMTTYQVLLDVVEGHGTLRENYDRLLEEHGHNLERHGFRRLSVGVPTERALLRLLVMGRSTSNKEQAEWFAKAFDELSNSGRQSLVDGLSVDGIEDGEAILPYYMPALFAGGLRNSDKAPASKVAALASLLRFLSRVYNHSMPVQGRPGIVVEHNLMYAMDVVKNEAFYKDPRVLDQLQTR
jgi:hypothetical protein